MVMVRLYVLSKRGPIYQTALGSPSLFYACVCIALARLTYFIFYVVAVCEITSTLGAGRPCVRVVSGVYFTL